jgi:hypothetical protein
VLTSAIFDFSSASASAEEEPESAACSASRSARSLSSTARRTASSSSNFSAYLQTTVPRIFTKINAYGIQISRWIKWKMKPTALSSSVLSTTEPEASRAISFARNSHRRPSASRACATMQGPLVSLIFENCNSIFKTDICINRHFGGKAVNKPLFSM